MAADSAGGKAQVPHNQLYEFGQFPKFDGFDDIMNFDSPLPKEILNQVKKKEEVEKAKNTTKFSSVHIKKTKKNGTKQEMKQEIKSDHNFEKRKSNIPKWCGCCNRIIWSVVGKKLYICSDCKLAVHKKCIRVTKQCVGTQHDVSHSPKLVPKGITEDLLNNSDLLEILIDNNGRKDFKEFVEKKGGEFGSWNLQLWEQCEEYKSKTTMAERQQSGLQIYSTLSRVNLQLGSGSLTQIKQKMEKMQFDDDMFDQAQILAFQEMQTRYFPEFVRQEFYKTLKFAGWQLEASGYQVSDGEMRNGLDKSSSDELLRLSIEEERKEKQRSPSMEEKSRTTAIISETKQRSKSSETSGNVVSNEIHTLEEFKQMHPHLADLPEKPGYRKSYVRPALPSSSFYSIPHAKSPNTPPPERLVESEIREIQQPPIEENKDTPYQKKEEPIIPSKLELEEKFQQLKKMMVKSTEEEDFEMVQELMIQIQEVKKQLQSCT